MGFSLSPGEVTCYSLKAISISICIGFRRRHYFGHVYNVLRIHKTHTFQLPKSYSSYPVLATPEGTHSVKSSYRRSPPLSLFSCYRQLISDVSILIFFFNRITTSSMVMNHAARAIGPSHFTGRRSN